MFITIVIIIIIIIILHIKAIFTKSTRIALLNSCILRYLANSARQYIGLQVPVFSESTNHRTSRKESIGSSSKRVFVLINKLKTKLGRNLWSSYNRRDLANLKVDM